MYEVIWHIKLSMQYLKNARKVPDNAKQKLYKILSEALKEAERQKEEWK